MTLIDYRGKTVVLSFSSNVFVVGIMFRFKCNLIGFRVVAMSLLPIDHTTLVYGSNNGGTTVVNSDPKLDSLMSRVLPLPFFPINYI